VVRASFGQSAIDYTKLRWHEAKKENKRPKTTQGTQGTHTRTHTRDAEHTHGCDVLECGWRRLWLFELLAAAVGRPKVLRFYVNVRKSGTHPPHPNSKTQPHPKLRQCMLDPHSRVCVWLVSLAGNQNPKFCPLRPRGRTKVLK
jgi:hypothetical protein